MRKILKNLRPVWRGIYDIGLTYFRNSLVEYRGDIYISKRNFPTANPLANLGEWELFCIGTGLFSAAGQILTHNGDEVITLDIGENGQYPLVIDGEITWAGDIIDLPDTPVPEPPDLSKFAAKVATITTVGSNNYRSYLMQDGSVFAVGSGAFFRNGDSGARTNILPIKLTNEDNITFVSLYSGIASNYAITAEGDVYSWGDNSSGQLGHGDLTPIATAKKIEYFSNNSIQIEKIFTSGWTYGVNIYCSYFLATNGYLYACGDNKDGNLGDGTNLQQLIPVRCGTLSNIKDVSVSARPFSVYAVDTNGNLYVWGNNSKGQLGLGNRITQTLPRRVTAVSGVSKAVVDCAHTMSSTLSTDLFDPSFYRGFGIILTNTGDIYRVGSNDFGQLATGDTTDLEELTRFTSDNSFRDIAISDGYHGNIALISSDNRVFLAGANDSGQLGTSDLIARSSIIEPIGDFQGNVTTIKFGGTGNTKAIVVQVSNRLFAAGENSFGNLGLGTTTNISTFSELGNIIAPIENWQIYGVGNSFGISVVFSNGKAYACGRNNFGQTGTQSENNTNELILSNIIF
ncbi:RCC1 domain-containing protein [Rickettsia endosymbiont of Cardiosporidium cionae]|uniref:RCC1 domain-containing protein n=1 Tax=Rickettsia endosymbiont of Cardiosporidium cionae TaxID=2777155 RepID=UPI001895C83F|nr:hypothetical protein [Rickettsia endosymbiont of Cardiosporidium cionae]KAF8818086.1 hypothetical protein IHI24_000885 [Rickettsia endosymbiont of Cardiosporidium cionae]